MCLKLYSWVASIKFDPERLTFVFAAKNIVLAGVKVCKPSIMLADCKGPFLTAFSQPIFLYSVCTDSHPSRHKAVWDVGSGLQLLHSQRGCVEPEEEVKYSTWLKDWNSKCKFLLPFTTFSFFELNFVVTFYYRVEAVCPRVAELNPYVRVDMSCSPLDSNTDLSFLRKFQVSRLWVWYWMLNSSYYYCYYFQKVS